MAKTTITLDAAERWALRLALIEQIVSEADRVKRTLEQRDPGRKVKRARQRMRRMCRLSKLLDRVGWQPPKAGASVSVKINQADLPLAVYALRDFQRCVHDGARDVHKHEDARHLRGATERLNDATHTLLHVEGLAGKLGHDIDDWPGRPTR